MRAALTAALLLAGLLIALLSDDVGGYLMAVGSVALATQVWRSTRPDRRRNRT